MRHLLDNLQEDLQSPPAAAITSNSSAICQMLPSDDVDDLLHKVFNENRGQSEDISSAVASTPLNQSRAGLEEVDVEFSHNEGEIFLNDNEHLNPRNTEDDNEVSEQVDELGKIMAESLRVSETQQEQVRGDISDDEF